MIGDDGRLKVLDFGLAKLREEARAADGTQLPTATVTQEGQDPRDGLLHVTRAGRGQSDRPSLGHLLAGGDALPDGDRAAPVQGRHERVDHLVDHEGHAPLRSRSLNQILPRHLGRIVRQLLWPKGPGTAGTTTARLTYCNRPGGTEGRS